MLFTSKWLCGCAAMINCPVCLQRHNILGVLLTGSLIPVCVFVCTVSPWVCTLHVCECACVPQCIYVSGWQKYIKGNTQLSRTTFLRGSLPETASGTVFVGSLLFEFLSSRLAPTASLCWRFLLKSQQVSALGRRMAAAKGSGSDLNTYQAGLERGPVQKRDLTLPAINLQSGCSFPKTLPAPISPTLLRLSGVCGSCESQDPALSSSLSAARRHECLRL